MSIPIRFALLRRQPSVEHPFQLRLTRRKPWKPERSPKLRIAVSFLSSEQNRHTDEHEATDHDYHPSDPAIGPGILRPFSANQEEESDQKKVGYAQCEMRL